MSDLVLDASLALQWFLQDESGVLASLSSKRAVVPILWFYALGNGLLMAHLPEGIQMHHRVRCLE